MRTFSQRLYAREQLRLATYKVNENGVAFGVHLIRIARIALLLWALWELRVTREGIVTMTLPKEAESQEEILQAFKQSASSCSENYSCEAQVCGLCLWKTRWPSLKKPTLIPFCQLQELLAKMQEISDDIYRLKGGWTAATVFRVWNQSPATARDPRPLAIESFR